MPILLSEVLSLDVFQRARPEVVCGEHLLDRPVRWVHTSELIEAATLLKGGELMLTTGLGLAGRGPVAQRRYVDELANRRAAALALELGWTFATVPDALLQAARARELPLIALHEIVPFVETTEEIQTRLVHARVTALSTERSVDDLLHERLRAGDGLSGLVEALASLLGCPTLIEGPTGEQVAWAGLPDQHDPDETLAGGPVYTAPIELLGEPWGWLHLVGEPKETPHLHAVLERAPGAITLALMQGQHLLPTRSRQQQEFIDYLMQGGFQSRSDLRPRAALAGLRAPVDGLFVGLAVGDFAPEDDQIALYATTTVAGNYNGLTAEAESCVLGLLSLDRWRDVQPLADDLRASIETFMMRRGATRSPRVTLGQPVRGLESVGRSLREAQSTLNLSIQLDIRERAVTAFGMDADRILAQVVDDPQVGWLIDDRLGPLIRYDRTNATDLVRTLWLYLMHGSSKTRTAEALHVRRQSVYQRLAKITAIIGEIDDPQRRLSLLLALKAYELRQRRSAD